MLHVWLVPALMLLAVAVSVFYLAIRGRGGSGVRGDGRTLHDVPTEEENLPP